MSTSSAMKPSGSAPGIVAASGAFGGSPSQPLYLAGTRTACTPPMFGHRTGDRRNPVVAEPVGVARMRRSGSCRLFFSESGTCSLRRRCSPQASRTAPLPQPPNASCRPNLTRYLKFVSDIRQHPPAVRLGRMTDLHDLAGVLHVHSTYSDGTGTVPEIAAAARANGLDFLLLTDHDTLAARDRGEEGWHDAVLMLVGEEVSPRRENHYLAFGLERPIDHARALAAADRRPRERGGRIRLPVAPVLEGLGALQARRRGHAVARPRMHRLHGPRALELRHRHRRAGEQHPRAPALHRRPGPLHRPSAAPQPRAVGPRSARAGAASRSAAWTRTRSGSACGAGCRCG